MLKLDLILRNYELDRLIPNGKNIRGTGLMKD